MQDGRLRVVGHGLDVRAVSVTTTAICEEARRRHGGSALATVALSRALTTALLVGAMTVKDRHRVGLQFRGDGSLGEVYADADGLGNVRGYVMNPFAEIPPVDGHYDLAAGLGNGFLSVTSDMGLKERYAGIVELTTRDFAGDVMHYFQQSAQTPTYAAVGVSLNDDGSVEAAGGFLVQSLPGKGENPLRQVEGNILGLPPLMGLLREKEGRQRVVDGIFHGFEHDVLADEPIRYSCPCSRERVERTLIALGESEVADMLASDAGANVRCEFCNEQYSFTAGDLENILDRMRMQ